MCPNIYTQYELLEALMKYVEFEELQSKESKVEVICHFHAVVLITHFFLQHSILCQGNPEITYFKTLTKNCIYSVLLSYYLKQAIKYTA